MENCQRLSAIKTVEWVLRPTRSNPQAIDEEEEHRHGTMDSIGIE